jgi:hypothetical protein
MPLRTGLATRLQALGEHLLYLPEGTLKQCEPHWWHLWLLGPCGD